MKKLVLICLLGVAAACMQSGCRRAKPVLQVCGPKELIKPNVIDRFERENGCTVVYNVVESDEEAIVAVEEGGQDVAIVSDQLVTLLMAQDALLGFDRANMPNLANLDPLYLRYTADHDAEVSAPVFVMFLGIVYEDDAFKGEFEASWNALNRAASGSVVLLPDDMRTTLGTALRALGFSANTTDARELGAARAVVIDSIRNGAKIESGTLKSRLQKDSPVVTPVSNREYLRTREESPELRFAIPWEGTLLSFQAAVIPADTAFPELAQSFINVLHDSEVAAENAKYALALCPNKASYRHLPRDVQADPAMILPASILARSETLSPLGDAEADYLAAWNEIQATK